MKRTRWLALPLKLLSLLALVATSGCMTPRTGEFYQETKAARIASWWQFTENENAFTYLSLFTVPGKLLLQGLDVALLNPLWDTLMLPVDAFFPSHARLLRVTDETGAPLAGASVTVEGVYTADNRTAYTLSSAVRDTALTDRDGCVRLPRLHTRYEIFDCLISAEGYHTRRAVVHANRETFKPVTDRAGRAVMTFALDRIKAPLDAPVRPFSVPVDWTHGEQAWVRGYDLAKSDWMPPFGRGVRADIAVALTASKAKGTKRLILTPGESAAAFARLPTRPSCDPRYFVIDYEIPALAPFATEVCLLQEGEEEEAHGNLLDATREYIAYRIRREDGVHVGALLPMGVGVKPDRLRNIYNPTPGSPTLEYR